MPIAVQEEVRSVRDSDSSQGPRCLLERIAAGEEGAMEACMEEYGGLVRSLARRHLGRGDIEDGVQEVFVALWRHAGRFDRHRGSEVSFVATVAQRKLIDHGRRNGVHRRAVLRSGEARAQWRPQPHDPGEGWRESARRADEALRELPDEVQDTLTLSLSRGMTYRHIGEAIGAPNGTIKSWASRGLQRLRERLDAEEWCGPLPG